MKKLLLSLFLSLTVAQGAFAEAILVSLFLHPTDPSRTNCELSLVTSGQLHLKDQTLVSKKNGAESVFINTITPEIERGFAGFKGADRYVCGAKLMDSHFTKSLKFCALAEHRIANTQGVTPLLKASGYSHVVEQAHCDVDLIDGGFLFSGSKITQLDDKLLSCKYMCLVE